MVQQKRDLLQLKQSVPLWCDSEATEVAGMSIVISSRLWSSLLVVSVKS